MTALEVQPISITLMGADWVKINAVLHYFAETTPKHPSAFSEIEAEIERQFPECKKVIL